MAFHGYQAFTNNLGISSVMVIFSLSGSLMLWTLSPTKVIEVQAKPQSTKKNISQEQRSCSGTLHNPPKSRRKLMVNLVLKVNKCLQKCTSKNSLNLIFIKNMLVKKKRNNNEKKMFQLVTFLRI
jgi:hypothetical protein